MDTKVDKFNGQGGTYQVNSKGDRELVEAATTHHEDGDRPRDADGKPIDTPVTTTEPALPAPAAAPWATPTKAAKVDKGGNASSAASKNT